MNWIAENWVILLLVGGMLAMHFFGHGRGHGGHGKSGGCCGGKTAKHQKVEIAPDDPDNRES